MPENERDHEQIIANLKMSETRAGFRESEDIAGDRTWTENENGYPKLETIHDPNQEVVREGRTEKAKQYEKSWNYHREKDDAGQWRDTEKVKSISETKHEHSEDGRTETVSGRHLLREHAWNTTNIYDEQGRLATSRGEITEGAEKGNTWTENNERRQVGNYTETISVNTSAKKNEAGELVEVRTVKIEYRDAQGKSVWGEKQSDGKPETYHAWGEEPADLPIEGRNKFADLLTETKSQE
jgi:hypothetical protein